MIHSHTPNQYAARQFSARNHTKQRDTLTIQALCLVALCLLVLSVFGSAGWLRQSVHLVEQTQSVTLDAAIESGGLKIEGR